MTILKITLSSQYHDERTVYCKDFKGFQTYLSSADDIDATDYRHFCIAYTTGVTERSGNNKYLVLIEQVVVYE